MFDRMLVAVTVGPPLLGFVVGMLGCGLVIAVRKRRAAAQNQAWVVKDDNC